MNVLHLNAIDKGGAWRATYRLHKNLKSAGHNSKIIVANKTIANPDIISIPYFLSKLWKFERLLLLIYEKSLHNGYFYRNSGNPFITTSTIIKLVPFKPDIIIVHWISNFITPQHLYELNEITGAPIIWHILDMGPLTGGCHYAFDCLGYTKRCGNCPAIKSKKTNDLSHKQWKEKESYLQKTNITLVSPTSWLTKQAYQSSIFSGKRIEQIMLALETDIFCPAHKDIARKALNLQPDTKIIFIGAQSIREERKGFKYLTESLHILNGFYDNNPEIKENIFIIVAGKNNKLKIPFSHKYLGWINDDKTLALAYQAADVFVCPSIEDSGPMMINESILCGTPVVSFDMGVAPDLVHSGKTGYRAKLKDSLDMACGIKTILELDEQEMQQMSNNCTNLGLKMCNPNVQTNAFIKLFDSLIAIENGKC